MKKVAIFDVDGTIFRSSILIEIVEALIEKGVFNKTVRKNYEKELKMWMDREGKYDDYINAVVKTFMDNIKGIKYGDFMEVAKEVISSKKNHVYRFTRDLVKNLKKRNYFLLAISQSPKGILDLFCKEWGFDKVYGRIYELGPQDGFTGKIIDEHLIANKANIVRRAIEKENLTLKDSVGVGDTDGDIPFLELVEKPICFNPNKKLHRYARLNGWRIVVERKDVVYEISSKNTE